MTIKLLTPRDLTIGGRYLTVPAGSIVTLDSATETGLIASKEATSDLSGGTTFSPPVPSAQPVPVMATPSDQGVKIPYKPKPLTQIRTVMLYGDSGVQYANFFTPIGNFAPVNDGSGTCTVNIGPHNYMTGTTGNIVNSKDPYWSAKLRLTRVSSTTISFPLDPRAAPTLTETANGGFSPGLMCFVSDAHPARSGYFHVLNAMLGKPWIYMGNKAANAKPALYMLDHVERDILSLPELPDAVWVQAGANDSRVLALPIEQCAANSQALIRKFLEAGIAVFYQPWQCNDSRDTLATSAGKAAIRFDNIMRAWAQKTEGVYYMPRLEAMQDPTSILGYAKTGVMATDGIHDTPISGMLCAKAGYDIYRPLIPKKLWDLPYSAADSQNDGATWNNRYPNPLFLATTGGAVSNGAGTVPFKVQLSKTAGAATVQGYQGTATYSAPRTKANDGDEYGNNIGYRITFTAGSEEQACDIVGDSTGLVVGDRVRFGAHIKTKLVSGARPKSVGLNLLPTQDAALYQLGISSLGVNYVASNPTIELPYDTDEVLFTPWFEVTGALTAVIARLWVVSIAAGVVDVEIGRPIQQVEKAGKWSPYP